jgi:protein RecA
MDRSALAKAVNKAIGDEAVDKPLVYLDTGYPPLNWAISGRYDGGIPAGRIYEISGGSSTGKTALATKLMVEAQKQDGFAIFEDWEHSFSVDLAQQFGLKTTPDFFAYDKPETWEAGNTKALQLAKLARDAGVKGPIVVVLDSIAAAIPRSMLYDNNGNERAIDEYTMNDTTALSRVTSTTLKTVKRLVDRLDVTMVYLNQTRTKPGVAYGDPTTTPGGSAMEFYADARLRLTRAQIKDKGSSEFLGQEINAKAIKSKFTPPFKTCSLRLMFNDEAGAYFDTTHSLIEHLKELGLIAKSGNALVWSDGKSYSVKELAKKINEEGKFAELVALLPKLAEEA